MHVVAKGIVLREVAYKETDKLLTVLLEGLGKRTVKARGCRRRNSPLAAGCQLLVWSEMTLYDYQDRWTLQATDPLREFRGVREDLLKLSLGSYFAEVAEAVSVEGEASPGMLSLLLNSLHALDKLDKPPELVRAAFDLKCMSLSGYEPLLDACAVCGVPEPEGAMLHLAEGVVYCARCRGGVGDGASEPLPPNALAAARHVVYGDPKRLFSFSLSPEDLAALSTAASGYLTTQLERGFKTLDFYQGLKGTLPVS